MARRRNLLGQAVAGDPRLAAWVASVPDSFSPEEARAAADRALTEARAMVRQVKWSFSGTLPPPPWPARPELVSAMERMEGLRDGFAVFATRTPNARWPKGVGKVGPAFMGVAKELYGELARLEAAWVAAQRRRDSVLKASGDAVAAAKAGAEILVKLIPDPRSVLAGWPVYVALYLLWTYRRQLGLARG